jgi:hypothetical protein
LLTRGARDLPQRQQTLRATMAWSYDLLSQEEQRLFRSLAVFAGGFSLDGAAALQRERAAEPDRRHDEASGDQTLDRLESLVRKNLLRVEPSLDGPPRFSMLATIQEYAQEQLDGRGEQADVQKRAVRFFLRLAQTAEPQLYEGERDAWMERLAREDANLRAALTWCTEHDDAVHLGLRLAGALAFYWVLTGSLPEGRSWLETLLARSTASDRSNASGRALYGAGLLARLMGDAEVAAQDAEAALPILRAMGDTLCSGYAELLLGFARMSQGQVADARPLLEECLRIFADLKSIWGEATTLYILGIGAELGDSRSEAIAYYKESLQRFQQIHDAPYSTLLLCVLAEISARQEDRAASHAYYEAFQRQLQQASNRWTLGALLLSSAYGFQHNYKLYETAKMLYHGGLQLWQDLQRVENGLGVLRGLVGLAEIAALQGHATRSGWLFGAADHLAPASGSYRETLNGQVAQVRGLLDAATTAPFEAAWEQGQTATLEQAIQTASGDLPAHQ